MTVQIEETSIQVKESKTKESSIQPRVLRAKQAASYLSVAESTFWLWVQRGKIPQGTRLGTRCTVWTPKELDQFLVENGVQL